MWSSEHFRVWTVNIKETVPRRCLKQLYAWHWFCYQGSGFSHLQFFLKAAILCLQLIVYDLLYWNLLLFRILQNIFCLRTCDRVICLLKYFVEHFLLLLLYFKSLNFLLFSLTSHFFLHRALFIFLNLSSFVHCLQSRSCVEQLFHFCLKIQVFVTFDWLVILHSISIKFNKIADHLFGRLIWKFKFNFVVKQSLSKVNRQLDFVHSSFHRIDILKIEIILFLYNT